MTLFLPTGLLASAPAGGAAPGPALTMSSPAYSTAPSGFGQQLTGGSGSSATPVVLPAGDYTFECWFTASAPSGYPNSSILTTSDQADGLTITGTGRPRLMNNAFQSLGPTPITDGVRHHLAAVVIASGGSAGGVFWLDGASVATQPGTLTPVVNPTIAVRLGLLGAVDEVRISKVARYTAVFTPPSAPFASDAMTVALWHLDGSGAAS